MGVDYKQLCIECFGTADVEKLKQIAESIKVTNTRNAGRKNAFTKLQVSEMREMQAKGIPQQEIAEYFGTTRQTVSRYLKKAEMNQYNMRIDYMYKTSVCTTIFVDFMNSSISIINKTSDLLHRAFGIKENPTWDDFEVFLTERCFSKSRGDCKSVLAALGLDNYDPIQIIEKTKGKTYEDHQWMRIRYGG